MKQKSQRTPGDQSHDPDETDHCAEHLSPAHRLLYDQACNEGGDQRRETLNQRAIDGGGVAKSQVKKGTEANHSGQTHGYNPPPVFSVAPLIGGPALKHYGEKSCGHGEAHGRQSEGSDVLSQPAAQDDVGGPGHGG